MSMLSQHGETEFLKEWLRAPLQVGAIAPSSSRLAAAMTEGISGETGPIIELGPGTGAFTGLLLARGVNPSAVAAIEINPRFASALRERFPGVNVIDGDASRIDAIAPFPPGSVGLVICGLPFLSMPRATVEQIVLGSTRLLRPGGAFRLFTYGLQCPCPPSMLQRGKLSARRVSRTLLNVPPASVYELEKP